MTPVPITPTMHHILKTSSTKGSANSNRPPSSSKLKSKKRAHRVGISLRKRKLRHRHLFHPSKKIISNTTQSTSSSHTSSPSSSTTSSTPSSPSSAVNFQVSSDDIAVQPSATHPPSNSLTDLTNGSFKPLENDQSQVDRNAASTLEPLALSLSNGIDKQCHTLPSSKLSSKVSVDNENITPKTLQSQCLSTISSLPDFINTIVIQPTPSVRNKLRKSPRLTTVQASSSS